MDERRQQILEEVSLLKEICKYLLQETGHVRSCFELSRGCLSFRVRDIHLADGGRLLMQLSFLVRQKYQRLCKTTVTGPRPGEGNTQAAYRTFYFTLDLDPWLLFFINQRLPPPPRYRLQPITPLLPCLGEVPAILVKCDNLPPPEALASVT